MNYKSYNCVINCNITNVIAIVIPLPLLLPLPSSSPTITPPPPAIRRRLREPPPPPGLNNPPPALRWRFRELLLGRRPHEHLPRFLRRHHPAHVPDRVLRGQGRSRDGVLPGLPTAAVLPPRRSLGPHRPAVHAALARDGLPRHRARAERKATVDALLFYLVLFCFLPCVFSSVCYLFDFP